MTLGEAARAAASRFVAAGIDTPEADARALAREAFGLDAARLIARAGDPADVDALARLEHLILRRLGGEPVDRILGRREFWGLDFTLAPETLAPRADTETVVQAALDAVMEGTALGELIDALSAEQRARLLASEDAAA